jgi:hypothetical protein
MLYPWLWILYAVAIGLFTVKLLLEPSSWLRRVLILLVALGLLSYVTVQLVDKLARHPTSKAPLK